MQSLEADTTPRSGPGKPPTRAFSSLILVLTLLFFAFIQPICTPVVERVGLCTLLVVMKSFPLLFCQTRSAQLPVSHSFLDPGFYRSAKAARGSSGSRATPVVKHGLLTHLRKPLPSDPRWLYHPSTWRPLVIASRMPPPLLRQPRRKGAPQQRRRAAGTAAENGAAVRPHKSGV